MAGSCQRGNEISGYIKGGTFLGQLRYYQLFREDTSVALVSQFIQALRNVGWTIETSN
jgi:hypothetical protein